MLEVGAIYKCSDGNIRKLNKIEDDYLHYSVPIGDKGKWQWMNLGRTYRWQAEPFFLGGKIIDQSEVES
ncbi:hypothetical protein [Paenibacillus sp. FSL R10-2771]|uniref:hypothetical protein n=1 Tax=Paenibacillus sp. FSL R10-2771 TaxID=2954693 RepID=UPI0030FB4663